MIAKRATTSPLRKRRVNYQEPSGGLCPDRQVEPTDLSFLRYLHILQSEMIWALGMAPGKLPAHLLRLRTQLQFAIVEKRRAVNATVSLSLCQNAIPSNSSKKFLTERHYG